jgi:hypothetical protein
MDDTTSGSEPRLNHLDDDEEVVSGLLKTAGLRPNLPSDRAARIEVAVRSAWVAEIAEQDRRQRSWRLAVAAVAAAAVVVVAIGLLVRRSQAPESSSGRFVVEVVSGDVRVSPPADEATVASTNKVVVGDIVLPGSYVETDAGGRAALRIEDQHSLRLDVQTRVHLVSGSVLELDRGTIYLDTESSGPGPALEVRAGDAVVRDIGTQLEVRRGDHTLRVRVRYGAVQLDHDGRPSRAEAGTELTLTVEQMLVTRSIPVFGTEWSWVLAVAPPFELEGASLSDYLSWVTRETGWKLRLDSSALPQPASEVVLRGSVDGLTPEATPAAVLPSCGLGWKLEGGTLHVGSSDTDGWPQ